MKSVRYIAAISLLMLVQRLFACAPIYYYPTEYYLFKLVDLPENAPTWFTVNADENCLLWQRQTSANIPVGDIHQLVYKYDIETLSQFKAHQIPEEAKDNLMAKWLVATNDQEAIDFLILAKTCEWLRSQSLSPWYYPSKNDPVKFSLNEVADIAKSHTQGRFADRYALQAVRAMTTLGQYDECIAFWKSIESRIPNGLMHQMILPYVAGAYFHTGDTEQAHRLFLEANDIEGLLVCYQQNNNRLNRVEAMELIYQTYPDHPAFRQKMWEILGEIEPDINWKDDWRWFDHSQEELVQLATLCDKVINGKANADKALWAYAASYIAHLQGNDRKADTYLKYAEKNVKDQQLSDAIKVMRIYLDAQMCPYNKAYEQKLFAQLQWLQSKIEADITPEVIHNAGELYHLNINISFYYWNDAMRCILLGTVCPRLLQAGNTTLALQLANMADYTLLKQTNNIYSYHWDFMNDRMIYDSLTLDAYHFTRDDNRFDYQNAFFSMADTLSADEVIAYLTTVEHPKSNFDRFINDHSYVLPDYLNEITGTHCLREMRFADAERYFSKVSAAYCTRTNIYKEELLDRDPFSLERRKWSHGVNAKYHFAKTMNKLEQEMATTSDPNLKAQLMIEFGTGLRNAFDYCWALTHYQHGYRGTGLDFYIWDDDQNTKRAEQRYKQLFKDALALFTDDEYAADAHYRFRNFKTVVERYPNTQTADKVLARCDRYWDYHLDKGKGMYLWE